MSIRLYSHIIYSSLVFYQNTLRTVLVWEISGDMIDMGNGNMITPLIDATNTKIANPNFDCSTLHDPTWALSEDQYRYAPDEPDTVDWSLYDAPEDVGGSTNDFNGAQTADSPYSIPADLYASFTVPAPSPPVQASAPAPSPSSNSSGDCPLSFTGYYATAGCTSYVYCTDGNGNVVGAFTAICHVCPGRCLMLPSAYARGLTLYSAVLYHNHKLNDILSIFRAVSILIEVICIINLIKL